MNTTATPLAVRTRNATRSLEVYFDGGTAVVVDRRRGHAVLIQTTDLRAFAQGEWADAYEYLNWQDGAWRGETEAYFRTVLESHLDAMRRVFVTVRMHHESDGSWHWRSREAVALALAPRPRATRTGWYTVG